MGYPPVFRAAERWIAFVLCLLLGVAQGYFVVGINFFSIDEYVDLEPGVTFEDVRPVIDWPLQTSLILACLAAFVAMVLVARRSRWAFPAILIHFAAAKSAWVLSTFLPYYDGGAIGAWLTVVQVVAIALIFRSTDQSWFRPRP
jgi:hypothetical protein